MRILLIIYIAIALLQQCTGYCQSPVGKSSGKDIYLNIGDTIPNFQLSDIVRYQGKASSIADFRGKLLILDFWSINCKACLAAMPKLDSIQDEFVDKIQVMMVTSNSRAQVEKLFRNNRRLSRLKLPSVVSDSTIARQFAFITYPTHVWVDPQGVILHITEGWNATRNSIRKVIRGEKVSFNLKREINPPEGVNWYQHLLSSGETQLLNYSVAHGFIHGLPFTPLMELRDSVSGAYIGLSATNLPLKILIQTVYMRLLGESFMRLGNRVIVEDKDSLLKVPSKEDLAYYNKWVNNTRVCYMLQNTGSSRENLLTTAKDDIRRYWGYEGKIEPKKIKCLAVIKVGPDSLLECRDPLLDPFWGRIQEKLVLRNVSFRNLIFGMEISNVRLPTPIVDLSGFAKKVDIEIESDLKDIPSLGRELKKYGLELVEKEMMIDMFVIRKVAQP